MTEPLLRTDTGGVATVTLHRPDRHNALTVRMLELLVRHLTAVATDPEVGALIVTGAGRSFCSGADTDEFAGRPQDPGRRRRIDLVAECVARLRSLPQPTIAVVTGAAHGAGWGLALACDLTYASADATFCLPEVPRGFTLPAPIVHRLREVVGPVRAASIALSGDRYTAADGLTAGWVAITGAADVVRRRADDRATALAAQGRAVLPDVLEALRAGRSGTTLTAPAAGKRGEA